MPVRIVDHPHIGVCVTLGIQYIVTGNAAYFAFVCYPVVLISSMQDIPIQIEPPTDGKSDQYESRDPCAAKVEFALADKQALRICGFGKLARAIAEILIGPDRDDKSE